METIKLIDVISNKLLPNNVIKLLPKTTFCECGEELEMAESFIGLKCTNDKCFCAIAWRICEMIRKLTGKTVDYEKCKDICSRYGLKYPAEIYGLLTKSKCEEDEGLAELNEILENSEYRRVQLWELVDALSIPYISDVAYKLFAGYRSFAEAYREYEKYQVPFIADKLGIKDSHAGVLSHRIYISLQKVKDELMEAETKFEVYSKIGDTQSIAVAGVLKGFNNTSEFIQFVNARYKGKISTVVLKAISEEVNVLINDTQCQCAKMILAEQINSREPGRIKVMTSEDFIKALDKKYN